MTYLQHEPELRVAIGIIVELQRRQFASVLFLKLPYHSMADDRRQTVDVSLGIQNPVFLVLEYWYMSTVHKCALSKACVRFRNSIVVYKYWSREYSLVLEYLYQYDIL